MFDPLACFDPKKWNTLEAFLSWDLFERFAAEDERARRCRAASQELDELLEAFAEEPEEEPDPWEGSPQSVPACGEIAEDLDVEVPEDIEEPEELPHGEEPDPWDGLRALEQQVNDAVREARGHWREESGEDRDAGIWFDSGIPVLTGKELLGIAGNLCPEPDAPADMEELAVLLLLFALYATAGSPESLADREGLTFLDWAIQTLGLPTEFTAERMMDSMKAEPFRAAMYTLRRELFYWTQALAEHRGEALDSELFRELLWQLLTDLEEAWVQDHPESQLGRQAGRFCREATEEFAQQLLRRRCLPL